MKILRDASRGSAWFDTRMPGFGRTLPAMCLALAVVLISNAAGAEPISTGAVFTGGDDTGFNFFGPDVSFMASRVLDPILNCAPCTPGSAFNVSTTLAVTDWAGRATVDGETYKSVYFRGLFDFISGSVIVPDIPPGRSGPDNEGLSHELTGFTFTGTLAGFAAPGPAGAPLSADLSGGGVAVVAFSPFPAESGTRVAQLDYQFESVAATPEPRSLLLLDPAQRGSRHGGGDNDRADEERGTKPAAPSLYLPDHAGNSASVGVANGVLAAVALATINTVWVLRNRSVAAVFGFWLVVAAAVVAVGSIVALVIVRVREVIASSENNPPRIT